jgi:hypothetical protein
MDGESAVQKLLKGKPGGGRKKEEKGMISNWDSGI